MNSDERTRLVAAVEINSLVYRSGADQSTSSGVTCPRTSNYERLRKAVTSANDF
jgi:hypothetical protein